MQRKKKGNFELSQKHAIKKIIFIKSIISSPIDIQVAQSIHVWSNSGSSVQATQFWRTQRAREAAPR